MSEFTGDYGVIIGEDNQIQIDSKHKLPPSAIRERRFIRYPHPLMCIGTGGRCLRSKRQTGPMATRLIICLTERGPASPN